MRITAFSVKNFQFTLVFFVMLAALGWNAFQQMPRSEDPIFPIPVVIVTSVYPGADPADMEKLVSDPLEDAIANLDDVKHIWSQSENGLSVVRVEFQWDKDAEKKYDEAIREIQATRSKLPADLAMFKIEKASPGLVSIMQMALVSPNASTREMRERAKELKDRLERVKGVRDTDIWGLADSEVQIALDPVRLARFHISLNRVSDLLKSDNRNIPGGAIEISARRFNIKTSGSYQNLDEIANTVIAQNQGQLVHLRDVATVRWADQEANYISRFNGKRAVFITASQKDQQNIFKVRDDLMVEIEAFKKTLSPDMRLEIGFDQSTNVDHRLTRLGEDFAIALGLVLLTLLPLGLRASGVVMISIPLSLALGMSMLYFSGFSLNQLSIAGFVLALGLLVDDSIVVVENIARFMRQGYSRTEAAIAATEQISLAVLGCTATLLFAFLPLLFLPEGAGKFIRSLPAAVLFTIIASLLVSFTIIPFLASRFLKESDNEHGNKVLQVVMGGIHTIYRPLLNWALTNPRKTIVAAIIAFVSSLSLIPLIGFSLFPNADIPQLRITVETPDGSAVTETDRAVQFVETTLNKHQEIKNVFANAGHGNPRVFYNIFPQGQRSNWGELFVILNQYNPKTTPQLYETLRKELAAYPAARIIVQPFENGPPIDAPIAIRLTGAELDVLRAQAARIEATMKHTTGTRDVVNPLRLARTDIDLGVDSEKAAFYGLTAAEVDRNVRLAIAGEKIGDFRQANGDEKDITIRLPLSNGQQRLSALEGLSITNAAGASIPLQQITTPHFVTAPNVIQRYHRQRSVTLTAYAQAGFNAEVITQQILLALNKTALPAGYQIKAAGQVEARQESFAGMNTAAMIAIFGILAVLILEFGNFKSTLIVAGVIPLGILGGIVALFGSGYSLSFTAMIGFIALIGIEIKNSILLVDFTNQLREQGIELLEAIQQAGEIRFLPILLTSLTAIGGLIPLATQGSALYSPMAWVIIGGLLASTFLARLVTPVLYLLLAPPMKSEAGC